MTLKHGSKVPADYFGGKAAGESEVHLYENMLLTGCLDKAVYGNFGIIHGVQVGSLAMLPSPYACQWDPQIDCANLRLRTQDASLCFLNPQCYLVSLHNKPYSPGHIRLVYSFTMQLQGHRRYLKFSISSFVALASLGSSRCVE